MATGTAVTLGTVSQGTLTFAQTLTKPWLFLNNKTSAYAVDGSVSPTTFQSLTLVGISGYSGSTSTTITSHNSLANGDSVTISGATYAAFNGTFTVSGVTSTSFVISVAYAASTGGSWIRTSAAGFPLNNGYSLAAGAVYSDGTVYCMTTTGRIYGSAIEDVLTWNALNYISKSSEPDGGVALAKHLNWIVAMGAHSTEFFYDAGGTYPTSPLLRNDASKIEIGCANGYSVVQFENNLMWVGVSRETGNGVFMLDGVSPIKVSTPVIEKYLNADGLTIVNAYAITIAGHTFYVMNLDTTEITLIYDLNENLWYQWSSTVGGVEQDFVGRFFTSLYGVSYCLNPYNGALSVFDINTYQDEYQTTNTRIVTPQIDGGSTITKFFESLQVVGDRATTTVQIRHTDDDYNTWTNYRTVNMNDVRPVLWTLGSSRRKAFELLHTDNTGLRLEAIELNVVEGSS